MGDSDALGLVEQWRGDRGRYGPGRWRSIWVWLPLGSWSCTPHLACGTCMSGLGSAVLTPGVQLGHR